MGGQQGTGRAFRAIAGVRAAAAGEVRRMRGGRRRPTASRAVYPRPCAAEALEARQLLTVSAYASPSPSSAPEGSTVYLYAGFCDPAGLPVEGYCVGWGDGAWTAHFDGNSAFSHTYNDGNYTAVLYAWNGDGSASSATNYSISESAPWVAGCGPSEISEGSEYTVYLGYSDAIDHVDHWVVRWGDGGASTVVPAGQSSATHTYADDGTYGISVEEYDADHTTVSHVGSGPGSLVVDEIEPSLWASAGCASEGSPFDLYFGASDPGADTISRVRVDWGDGATDVLDGSGYCGQSHTYSDNGDYTVIVTMWDEDRPYDLDSPTGGYSTTVQVPAAEIDPSVALAGPSTVYQDADLVLYPSYSDPADSLSGWFVDWGDGSTGDYGYSEGSFSHQYTQPGNYTVTATANDNDGPHTTTAGVDVGSAVPGVWAAGTDDVSEGSDYGITFGFDDPSGRTPDYYTVDFGDGPSTTITNPDPACGPLTASHAYDAAGDYTVVVTAHNLHGDASWSQPVHVDELTGWAGLGGNTEIDEGSAVYLQPWYCDPGRDSLSGWVIDFGDGCGPVSCGSDVQEVSHSYADDGTYTVTATAINDDGSEVIESVAVVVNDVDPWFGVYGSGTADEGSSYALNYGFTDPGDDHVSSVTVDWGDGQSDTYSASDPTQFTHVYADPGYYPVMASLYEDGGGPYEADAFIVHVLNHTPAVTASGNASVGEASTYTLITTFDDSSGDVAGWTIDWGDGTGDQHCGPAARSFTHSYAHGGTAYGIVATATAEDGLFSAATSVTVDGGPSAPSDPASQIDAWIAGGSTDEHSSFVLDFAPYSGGSDPCGSDPSSGPDVSGDYTILWGDGSSDTVHLDGASGSGSSGSSTAGSCAHGCDEEGQYLITITGPSGRSGYEWVGVADAPATLDSMEEQTVEAGDPVTIATSFSAADLEDAYSAFADWGDGRGPRPADIDGNTVSATLDAAPPGVLTPTIILYDEDGPSVSVSTQVTASVSLAATLGDGSTGLVLESNGDGRTNLTPLDLTYPSGLPTGTVLTLTTTASDKVDVWTSSSPGSSQRPVIGAADDSQQWVVGRGTLPTTLYVGLRNSSQAVGDITLSILAQMPGVPLTSPTPTPIPSPAPASTNPATGVTVKVIALSDPNGVGILDKNVAGNTQDWLVGQYVDLDAQVAAPAGFVADPVFQWDVPGDTLVDYVVDTTAGTATTTALNSHTGLGSHRVKFFWVSASVPGPDQRQVTAHAVINATDYNSSTTFNVYSPVATTKVQHASLGFGDGPADRTTIGLQQGKVADPRGVLVGALFKAVLNTPQPAGKNVFKQGIFHFLQTDKIKRVGHNFVQAPGDVAPRNYTITSKWPSEITLDTSYPYHLAVKDPDPFDAQNGWLTDANEHWTVDTPRGGAQPGQGGIDFSVDDSFSMHVMYKPPGAKSRWVPLKVYNYSFKAAVTYANDVPALNGPAAVSTPDEFAAASAEPVWQHVHSETSGYNFQPSP